MEYKRYFGIKQQLKVLKLASQAKANLSSMKELTAQVYSTVYSSSIPMKKPTLWTL